MIYSIKNNLYRNTLAFVLFTIAIAGFAVKVRAQAESAKEED